SDGEQKKKKQGPGQQQPAEYPKPSQSYKPHTKDSEGGKQPHQGPPVIISEVNVAKVPYFITQYFNTVTRGAAKSFQESPLPGWKKALSEYIPTSTKLKINLIDASEGIIVVPMGFEPTAMNPSRAGKIQLLPDGKFHL